MKKSNRRNFIKNTALAASGIIAIPAIIPSCVRGGDGNTAPSDKVTVANIGCGTQGLREMPDMLENEDIQVVAVADPNKFTTNYLDWSADGIRNSIRKTLDKPDWGSNYQGIPGGRDIGKEYVETYYGKNTHTPYSKRTLLPSNSLCSCGSPFNIPLIWHDFFTPPNKFS